MDLRNNSPKALIFVVSAGSLLPEVNGKLKSKSSQVVKSGEPIFFLIFQLIAAAYEGG